MARHWTAAQRAAIDTRDRTLLVSAAAGSGKTAVLTERVISSILDEKNPMDISRMLIVTFTKAAAAELRTRITDALRVALREKPNDRRLEEQLLLLPSAEIRTIDSFCADFLRRYAAEAGVSPRFRIADEAESALLAAAVMEELLTDCYEGVGFPAVDGSFPYCREDFLLLADSLTAVRAPEGTLAELLLSLYRKSEGLLDGALSFSAYAAKMQKEADGLYSDSSPFHLLANVLEEASSHYLSLYLHALFDFDATAEEKLQAAHGACFHKEAIALKEMADALHVLAPAKALAEADGLLALSLRSYRGEKNEADLALREVRTDMRKFVKDKALPLLLFSEADWQREAPRLARVLAQLAGLLAAFEKRLFAEKKDKHLLEYSDLERLTLELLTLPDGEATPSPLALSVQGHYDAIYIDEYQDVNQVQNLIFSRLSNGKNAFMVGDIKQSIYRFRGAEPTIFSALRGLPPLKEDLYQEKNSLFMQTNFRCDPAVIDFSNAVFDVLLASAGGIDYREEDRLTQGKLLPDTACPAPAAVLLSAPLPKEAHAEGEDAADTENGRDGEEELTASQAEARVIAREIGALLATGYKNDGTRIEPRDVAILLRSVKSAFTPCLLAELRELSIPAEAHENTDFFLNPEVLLVLSLLNVIDNPRRDIYLAGLLRSPLFGFSMDELLAFRRAGTPDSTLYECLVAYEEKTDDARVRRFLETLSRYRDRAEGTSVSRLLRFLYDDTAVTALPTGTGKDNLHMLYHYAVSFEAGGKQGLYPFLQYIDRIVHENRRLPAGRAPDATKNAVRIMTVHASKGLEFPVCFFSRASSRFHMRNDPLLFDGALGMALRLRTEDGLGFVDNPLYSAVLLRDRRAEREEDLRVLYVALTRARERLYVTGHAPKPSALARPLPALPPSPFEIRESPHYLAEILLALGVNPDAEENDAPDGTLLFDTPFVQVRRALPAQKTECAPPRAAIAAASAAPALDIDALRRRFDFVYPYEASANLPGKLSVSRLYPDVLDKENETDLQELSAHADGTPASEEAAPKPKTRPAFMKEKEEADAARRGTATHLFMQFARFENLQCPTKMTKKEAVEKEIKRLTDAKFLTPEDAKNIRINELCAFLTSPLFASLLTAKELHRELRFHAHLPAACFTRDEEKKKALDGDTVFVQGVVDCVPVYADGSYDLIDYKTDRLPKDRGAAEALLKERHTLQLSYYRAACRRMFGKPPRAVLIYSLPLGDTVSVDIPSELLDL